MLGLMLTGTEVALREIASSGPLLPRPLRWRPPAPSGSMKPTRSVVAGSVLITLSSQVKLPGLLALGFVAMALAHRWGGTLKAFFCRHLADVAGAGGDGVRRMDQRAGIRLAVHPRDRQRRAQLDVAADSAGAGHRPGRHSAGPGRPHHRGAVADPCDGRADHRDHGELAAAGGAARRLHPVGGLGVALGATVLLFPVVQPWYLLWAIIPQLAAWATRPGFRIATIAVTLIVGIFGPTANGDRFALFQIIDATVASTLIVVLLIATGAQPPAVALCARHRRALQRAGPEPVGRRTRTPTLSHREFSPVNSGPAARRVQALQGHRRGVRPRSRGGACAGAGTAGPQRRRARPPRSRCARASPSPTPGTIEVLGLDPIADNAQLRERIGVMLQGGGGYRPPAPARC